MLMVPTDGVFLMDLVKKLDYQKDVDISAGLGTVFKKIVPQFSTIVPLGNWGTKNLKFFCSAEMSVSVI